MPASKKRIKLRSTSTILEQNIPEELKEWSHLWHGVKVSTEYFDDDKGKIFHAGFRAEEELSLWKQIVRLPSNSLFYSVRTIDNPRKRYKDFLYVLLNMRWAMLMTVLFAVFFTNVLVFAFILRYGCGETTSYLEAFNLSYHTFSTIGFGIVFPHRTCANLVVVLESFLSLLVTSAITGLVFAKFAKPKAKVAFSKVCVIQPYGKKYLALVMRVANATQLRDITHDVIMEANFKVNLLCVNRINKESVMSSGSEENDKAESSLSSYNLKLLQNNFITFRMGIAVVHVIDESSPLFGLNEEDIRKSDMIMEIAMSGVDSTLQDTVSERYVYTSEDFRWGYRFAEMLTFHEKDMDVVMDFEKLSAIEKLSIDDSIYLKPSNGIYGKYSVSSLRKQPAMSIMSPIQEQPNIASNNQNILTNTITGSSFSDETTCMKKSQASVSVPTPPKRKKVPNKFGLNMEPLFEPLLSQPVGTQRLENSEEQSPFLKNLKMRSLSGPLIQKEEDRDLVDQILKSRHVQQLQHQLAGGEISDDEDDDEEEEGEHEKKIMSRQRNMSVISVEMEDTPRFLHITPINIPKSYSFMRLYNSALYLRWPKIIMVLIFCFVIINLIFAFIYWFRFSQIVTYPEVQGSSFEIAFYMSVHTFATIGYGSISPIPEKFYMNLWVTVESALGIIASTIFTGIAWSKFARPRAHIHFSSKVLFANFYGHRCLMLRAANTRHSGDVHENFFRIGVILNNRKTGLRQLYDVPLVQAEFPSIKLPATLVHIIDESSPFYKLDSLEALSASRVAVIALLTGLDTTFSENVYGRKMYFWEDFAFDMRFQDFALLKRDSVVVDFNKFDALIPDPSMPFAPV